MKYITTLFIFIITASFLYGQTTEKWKLVKTIPHKADKITTDKLGNVFLYNHNFIWMYNSSGDSIAAFNSRKFGEITLVDATDPYKILVFFSDYNLIVLLDNYLSENGEAIDLQQLGFDQVSMACTSRDNGIWIYDAIKQKALHLNSDFKVSKQTVNLAQWFGSRIEPNFMLEYNNQLYINEAETNVYLFDHFGTFQKKLPLKSLKSFQVMDKDLLFFKGDKSCRYNHLNFEEQCRDTGINNLLDFRIEKGKFYAFKKKELLLYFTN